ncbi:MAG: hypothetical protein KBS85_00460 [Lachnospiraceae bacterium]|nr:hypothetical protein [Candidatus Merdinaster equi]
MLFRDKKGRLIAGLELGNSISQLSYCYSDRLEPETFSTITGKEQFAIPTLLAKREDVNQWYWGPEALAKETDEDVVLVKELVSKALEGVSVPVADEAFSPISLLALFIKRTLAQIGFVFGGEASDYLMITSDDMDVHLIGVLEQVMEEMSMDRSHFFFQSHAESFYQYVMHQGKELRGHDLLLLDSRNGLSSMRMEMNVAQSPAVSFMEQQTHDKSIMEAIPEDDEDRKEVVSARKDEKFLEVLKGLCDGRIVNAVFLIGDGFGGGWMKESLRFMCGNKRVFQGNNLYSKGACYGAAEKVYPSEVTLKNVFLGRDKIRANVGILAVTDGEEKYLPLFEAGANWFDIEVYKEFILEEDAAIKIVITPMNGREKRQLQMVLEGFPPRPPKASRISLNLSFEDEEHMKLAVRDMGFGELFKKTDYLVEDVIEI